MPRQMDAEAQQKDHALVQARKRKKPHKAAFFEAFTHFSEGR